MHNMPKASTPKKSANGVGTCLLAVPPSGSCSLPPLLLSSPPFESADAGKKKIL